MDIKKVPTLVGIYQCFLSCAHRKSGEFKSNRFILFNDEKNIQVAILGSEFTEIRLRLSFKGSYCLFDNL